MDISVALHCSNPAVDHKQENVMLSKFIFVKVP
jgi:hypothetical protein